MKEFVKTLNKVPLLGDPVERFLAQLKEGVKAGLHGGMLFEDLGIRYIGPIDGHNIGLLRKYLRMAKKSEAPMLAARGDRKRPRFPPGRRRPRACSMHAAGSSSGAMTEAVAMKKGGTRTFTNYASLGRHPHGDDRRRARDRDDRRDVPGQ